MSTWLTIPSARPDGGTVSMWRDRGYRIALWRDTNWCSGALDLGMSDDECIQIEGPYPGWATAINVLARSVFAMDQQADWCVGGGDDTAPDLSHSPEEIAAQCNAHFGGAFGVMQPTGDRWADGSIDRICGSPWLGRELCARLYRGNGPIWPEFLHMHGDEHLQAVAEKLGILWQRRDLIHLHNHYFRTTNGGVDHQAPTPPHMVKWNSRKHWDESKAIFDRLKAGGFTEANDLLPHKVAA